MPKMTGGQILMKSLALEGVKVIFGLPGVQTYHAVDALHFVPEIRFITTRHEQATAYMADGYSRASGEIGTALVVPGPGLLNASAAIGTAYASSSPIMVVSGQIPRDHIGANRGMLHEVDDQLVAIRQVTKWAKRVLDPTEIPDAVHEAFYQLRTGRPRPVEIEIPPDTLAEETEVQLREPADYFRPAAPENEVREAARILAGARNPLIMAGGGVITSRASDALQKLAEYLQAPLLTTAEGKGALSDRHYLCLGALRGDDAELLSQHDVILAVGTRMTSGLSRGTPQLRKDQRVVQIDIDPSEIGRNFKNTVGVVGDAKRTLEGLQKALAIMAPAKASRKAEMERTKAARAKTHRMLEPQAGFSAAIRAALPDDGILVTDMTQLTYYCRAGYPVYEPGTYITSSYFGNLGYAFPLALGVKVAKPDTPVVSVSGDGGFQYASQELSTAVQYGINLVAVVFKDNAYGNVMRDQETDYHGKLGSELHNPDFVKLARAYGARGVRVRSPERLESAIKEAIGIDAPTVIEVPVGPMPSPW